MTYHYQFWNIDYFWDQNAIDTSFILAEYVWKTDTENSNVMDFRYNLDQPGSPSFFRPLALTASNVIK